jgi:hypothetical protein
MRQVTSERCFLTRSRPIWLGRPAGVGKGPQVAGWFGPRCLYETADLEAWAQSRFIAATDVCADLGIDRTLPNFRAGVAG